MAWGRGSAAGLDDLCARLRNNDPNLVSLTLLKHRKVDDGEIRKLCSSLEHNTSLTELYASNHAVSPAAAALVAQLLCNNTTLKSLCLGNSGFGDAGVAALAPGLCGSSSLHKLDFENKNVTAAGAADLAKVLSQNSSLQHLSLARNPIGDEGAAALSQSPWQSITHLDLSACELGPAGLASLASQQSCKLVSLNLNANSLASQESGAALRQLLASFTTLQRLHLRSCSLPEDAVEGLAAGLANHPCLEHLDLSDNTCGDVGGSALADAVRSAPRLQHLDLGSNKGMTAASVQILAEALCSRGASSAVNHVNLTGVNLQGDAGAAALQALSGCSLQQLCLLGTGLGAGGARALLDCLDAGGFSHLQELSISACDLDLSSGLGPILSALLAGKAPALKVLECGANPACQDDSLMQTILQLREARPELQVHWSAMDDAAKVEVAAGGGAPPS